MDILGTETLGVRGLCCFIELGNTKVLVDPGMAMGFTRYGLHPHPLQAVVGDQIKKLIRNSWRNASDIVISHLHGDHTPLSNPNPFQFGISLVEGINSSARIWVKPEELAFGVEKKRLCDLRQVFGEQISEIKPNVEFDGVLQFYGPFPHGGYSKTAVVVTVIRGKKVFMHTSDIDILDRNVVKLVEHIAPDIILMDGPPIYLWFGNRPPSTRIINKLWNNILNIAESSGLVIIDHHITRCDPGLKWIEILRENSRNIFCAAEFMKKPILMLESWRLSLIHI